MKAPSQKKKSEKEKKTRGRIIPGQKKRGKKKQPLDDPGEKIKNIGGKGAAASKRALRQAINQRKNQTPLARGVEG